MKIITKLAHLSMTKVATTALAMLAIGSFANAAQSIFPVANTVSTVPSNGDVNPYGVAFVPDTVPVGHVLTPRDILISNFNNSANLQGLGTTITRVDRHGQTSTFYTSSSPQTGLTAALGILSNGWVLIGNLPTLDGTSNTVKPGSLAVLDADGKFLGRIGNLATVNGPWGMAVVDDGNGYIGVAHIFVSNVLSGVISRFDLEYAPGRAFVQSTVIADGFSHRTDPAAIVLGPSGLSYDPHNDILYVASSLENAVYQIANAAHATTGQAHTLLFQDLTHLHGPLDMTTLPNGHFLIANSDGSNADPNQPSELVEYTREGVFVGQMPVDPNNGGAFGLAVNRLGPDAFRLSAVDDNQNTLTSWTVVSR